MEPEVIINNASELAAAYETLSQSTGGTIIVASGANLGSINLSNGGVQAVKIVSEDELNPAVIDSIDLENVSNLEIDGVLVSRDAGRMLNIEASTNITIRNSEFASDATQTLTEDLVGTSAQGADVGIVRDTSGLILENNEFHGFFQGITMYETSDVQINNNEWYEFQGDGIRMEGVQRVDIMNNNFYDYYGSPQSVNHSDFIQVWSANGTETITSDLRIISNTMHTGDGTAAQGIFINNEAFSKRGIGDYYQNIEVSDNVIYSAMWNGIRVNGTDGAVISNNTLLWNQDALVEFEDGRVLSQTPTVRADNSLNVEAFDNIARTVRVNDVDQEQNVMLEYRQESSNTYAYDLFPGLDLGADATLGDLALVEGSGVEGAGASSSQPGQVEDAPSESETVSPPPESETESPPSESETVSPPPESETESPPSESETVSPPPEDEPVVPPAEEEVEDNPDPVTEPSGEAGKTIHGTSSAETISGTIGDDSIFGYDRADAIFGGDGNDLIEGGRGFDDLNGGRGDDDLHGGSGHDVLNGGEDDDTLSGDAGNDTLNGGEGSDVLQGGRGGDLLYGDAGNDFLFGGMGSDELWGGEGDDTMSGEGGRDVFHIGSASGNDIITDFQVGKDLLALESDPTSAIQTDNGLLLRFVDDSSLHLDGVTLEEYQTEQELFFL